MVQILSDGPRPSNGIEYLQQDGRVGRHSSCKMGPEWIFAKLLTCATTHSHPISQGAASWERGLPARGVEAPANVHAGKLPACRVFFGVSGEAPGLS